MMEPTMEGPKRAGVLLDIDTIATARESALPTPFAVPAVVNVIPTRSQASGIRVGACDDPAEVHADRVADRALTALRRYRSRPMPHDEYFGGMPTLRSGTAGLASLRKVSTVEWSSKDDRDEPPSAAQHISTAAGERGNGILDVLRRRGRSSVVGPDGGALGGDESRAMAHALGGGAPLAADVRETFGQAIGADLSSVRIHEGASAAVLSRSVGARAFTLGKHVFFRDGLPDTSTDAGAHLLAHELAHTVAEPTDITRLVARRVVVAQLALNDADPVKIVRLHTAGRPPNTYGDTMGDHSTAFTVHVNAVQLAVENKTLPEALTNMHQLVGEIRNLPGYGLVTDLPPRQAMMWAHALAGIVALRQRLDQAAVPDRRHIDTFQRYIAGYLELRELVPLSTINTGKHSKATAGKGKGESVSAMRAEAAGAPQPGDLLGNEVIGTFDAQAAAVLCVKNDSDVREIAPAMPQGLNPYERARMLTTQHLRSIQTAFPGVLAAVAQHRPEPKEGEMPEARRFRLQQADQAVLTNLAEELTRNHVIPKMMPLLLKEQDRLLKEQRTNNMEQEEAELERIQSKWDEPAVKFKAKKGTKRKRSDSTDAEDPSAKRMRPLGPLEQEQARIEALIGAKATTSVPTRPSTDPTASPGGRPPRKASLSQKFQVDKYTQQTDQTEKNKHDSTVVNKMKQNEADQRKKVSTGTSRVGKIRKPLAVQVLLNDKDRVGEVRFAGRTPSPFPGTMGAHTTSWIVHLDRVHRELAGRTVTQAITVVRDQLAKERDELAKSLPAFVLPAKSPLSVHPPIGPEITMSTSDAVPDEDMGVMDVEPSTGPHPTAGPQPGADVARLAELQSAITDHLTLLNQVPGATLPDIDTGGKGESKHRRVLLEHLGLLHFAGRPVKHSQPDVNTAVLGLLDVKSLAKNELDGGYLNIKDTTDNAVHQLVKAHFTQIDAAYPGALAAAGLDKSDDARRIADHLMTHGGKPPGSASKVLTPRAVDSSTSGGTVPVMDESVFGGHSQLSGLPWFSGLPNLLPWQYSPPDRPGAALAAQWADQDGDLKEDKVDTFAQAYLKDTLLPGVHLAEGEGPAVAKYFKIALKVYRDTMPDGFARIENIGGGDCLIHAIKDADAARQLARNQHIALADIPGRLGLKETRAAGGDEITQVRATIYAHLVATEQSKLDTRVAASAIFRDAVSGRGTRGLGKNMLELLANPGVAFAISWTANNRRFAEQEQKMNDAREAKKAAKSGAKSEGAEQPLRPSTKAVVEQGIYGEGPVEANVALLHVGGDHYVALVRR